MISRSLERHTLTLEAQPIADQWMGKCYCGWRYTASLYDFDTREAAIKDIRAEHRGHVFAATGDIID